MHQIDNSHQRKYKKGKKGVIKQSQNRTQVTWIEKKSEDNQREVTSQRVIEVEENINRSIMKRQIPQKIKLEMLQKKYECNPDATIEEVEMESSGKSKNKIQKIEREIELKMEGNQIEKKIFVQNNYQKHEKNIKFETFKEIIQNLKIESFEKDTGKKLKNSEKIGKKKKKYNLNKIKSLLIKKDKFPKTIKSEFLKSRENKRSPKVKKAEKSQERSLPRVKRNSKEGGFFPLKRELFEKRNSLRRADKGIDLSYFDRTESSYGRKKKTKKSRKFFLSQEKANSKKKKKSEKMSISERLRRLKQEDDKQEMHFRSYFGGKKKKQANKENKILKNLKKRGIEKKSKMMNDHEMDDRGNNQDQSTMSINRIIKSSKKNYHQRDEIAQKSRKRCSLRRTNGKHFQVGMKQSMGSRKNSPREVVLSRILSRDKMKSLSPLADYNSRGNWKEVQAKVRAKASRKHQISLHKRKQSNFSERYDSKLPEYAKTESASPLILSNKKKFLQFPGFVHNSVQSNISQVAGGDKKESETITLLQETLKHQNNFLNRLMNKLEGIDDIHVIKEQNTLLRDENKMLKQRLSALEAKVNFGDADNVHGERHSSSEKKFESFR